MCNPADRVRPRQPYFEISDAMGVFASYHAILARGIIFPARPDPKKQAFRICLRVAGRFVGGLNSEADKPAHRDSTFSKGAWRVHQCRFVNAIEVWIDSPSARMMGTAKRRFFGMVPPRLDVRRC
jgi:hypothetical protein